MKKFLLLAAGLIFCTSSLMAADFDNGKLVFGEDMWISAHLQLKTNLETAKKTDLNGDYWSKDANSPSVLLLFPFQVKKLSGLVDYTASSGTSFTPVMADAYINYAFADFFQITMGQIALPFMHQTLQSSKSFLGTGDNSSSAYALYSQKYFREHGIQFRGYIMNAMFEYRVGVFQGVNRTATATTLLNKYDWPRVTGRIQINFLDPEKDFFYHENYLGKKKMVSVGFGFDGQPRATAADSKKNYMAYTADLNVDYSFMPGYAAIMQLAVLEVRNQPSALTTAYEDYRAAYVQAGCLIMEKYLPYAKYIWRTNYKGNADKSDQNIQEAIGGFNYYINGYNTNVKIEYCQPISSYWKDQSGKQRVTFQAQLFI